ncbi:MAG: hypothetical protein ABR906_08800 [Terracidiphilus sp.]|jgi:hypothetical protein
MPTDLGIIANYHLKEADRFADLAQAAREDGDLLQAEYLEGQAARYTETAQEQKKGFWPEPARPIVTQRSVRRTPKPQSTSLAAALRSCAERIFAAVCRSTPKKKAPFHGLTLR